MRGTIVGLALVMTIAGAGTARAGEELAPGAASAATAPSAPAASAFTPEKAASFTRKLSVSSARPAPLLPMYASFAALETYDAVSTLRALRSGGAEANPVMGGVVKSPAALIATKAALTTASIFAAERLWKEHHRGGAIALMAISNGFMSMVAAHNASALGQLR